MVHLDSLSERLKPMNITVVGLLDSPLWLDLTPLDQSVDSFGKRMSLAYQNFGVAPFVPEDCKLRFKSQEWRCIMGQYRLHFIKSPFVVYADQNDGY